VFYNPRVSRFSLLSIIFLNLALSPALWSQNQTRIQSTGVQSTGVDANLRGISVTRMGAGKTSVGKIVVWASGSKGTVLRSLDEGKSWIRLKVDSDSAAELDFRDVEAFGKDTAYVMSSGEGEKSRIYKTTDGGRSWKLQYTDKRSGFFLDSLACESRTYCFALSDPVDGRFLVLSTSDGRHWKELPPDKMPTALPAEGAFAASGTSIALCNHNIYFGTGGPAARVFRSDDHGRSWTAAETPMASGNASSGIFSLACSDRYVIAVGGDYKNPESAERVAAYSADHGKTWHPAEHPPTGYRSSVSIVAATAFAVGPTGEDVSLDYGASWKAVDSLNLNAAALTTEGGGWAVGPKGTVKHFQVRVPDSIRRQSQREKSATQ
jgi:photosystem II stability/assembly factor-like uncharacterized protein